MLTYDGAEFFPSRQESPYEDDPTDREVGANRCAVALDRWGSRRRTGFGSLGPRCEQGAVCDACRGTRLRERDRRDRAVLRPLLAEREFDIASNAFSPAACQGMGRKNMPVTGWLFTVPMAAVILFASERGWVVGANLLPVSTRCCAGLPGSRVRPAHQLVLDGFRDFFANLCVIVSSRPEGDSGRTPRPAAFRRVLLLRSWKNQALFSAGKAGLVNNLKDGLAWDLRFSQLVALTNQLSRSAPSGGNCARQPGGLSGRTGIGRSPLEWSFKPPASASSSGWVVWTRVVAAVLQA